MRLTGKQLTAKITTQDVVVAGHDSTRRVVALPVPDGAKIAVAFGVTAANASNYQLVSPGVNIQIFSYEEFGDLVCQDVHVVCSATQAVYTFWVACEAR